MKNTSVDNSATLYKTNQLANGLDFTATGIENIVGWGMPDYSTEVEISTSSEFTAGYDGFLYVSGNAANNASGTVKTEDGGLIYNNWAGGGYASSTSDIIMIPKGLKLTFSQIGLAKFYAVKGA